MKESYEKGLAFIFEGDTEKYFYINFLEFLCSKHPGWSIYEIESDFGGTYIMENDTRKIIVCTNTVGTITQVVHSGNWFNNACADKYSAKTSWDVFLCYDTDSHEYDVTKFQVGDWKTLRSKITRRSNVSILDIAASADIEDVFLKDLSSISCFLGLETTLTDSDIPSGRKGKIRLKALFRKYGKTYHEGIRALPLIEALDKQKLIDIGILPLEDIENSIF